MGPIIKKQFFLLNQTVFGVAAGEPHPQPRYQTLSKSSYTMCGYRVTDQFWPSWNGIS